MMLPLDGLLGGRSWANDAQDISFVGVNDAHEALLVIQLAGWTGQLILMMLPFVGLLCGPAWAGSCRKGPGRWFSAARPNL